MEDLLKRIKDLKILSKEELAYLQGLLEFEPYPVSKQELEILIKEAIKNAKK